MGRARAGEPAGQRRQKRRHGPQVQREEDFPPSPPQRELRPHRRPGKESAGSSSQTAEPSIHDAKHAHASSILSKSNKKRPCMGVCPWTPPGLQVEFTAEQSQYPHCPKLARPRVLPDFAVQMGRNYYKQAVGLREAQKEEGLKSVKG